MRGNVTYIDNESCILDVNGVGYKVFCSKTDLEKLNKKKDDPYFTIQLHTQLIHREESMDLYGFIEKKDFILFNLLLKVRGVGPKNAIRMLGMNNSDDIIQAITGENVDFLIKLSGIGKKKAEHIILELKEKLPAVFGNITEAKDEMSGAIDAIAALESLGFTQDEARKAVKQALESGISRNNVGVLVQNALKNLTK